MSKKIVVLESFPTPKETTNPYITMLWTSLSALEELEVKTFSWREALLGRYDVVHFHWPEILVTGRTRLRKIVRQALFVLFVLRLVVTKTPIVRTVHNLHLPKDIGWTQTLLLKWLDRLTTVRIVLNSQTKLPADQLSSLVVHGHYKDWFEDVEKSGKISGRISYFGLIRGYKRVDRLIAAFRETAEIPGKFSLHIAGKPSSNELTEQLTLLAGGDNRIDLSLRFQTDTELVKEVSESQLVVLPYEEMHNSGGVLTALSLGTPVLVPDNEVNRELAEEVGSDWVHRYSGELTGEILVATLAKVQSTRQGNGPNLDSRDWDRAGLDHLNAFKSALSR